MHLLVEQGELLCNVHAKNEMPCESILATRSLCHALPKAELHAHLTGSVRNDTIRKLLHRPVNGEIRKKAEKLLAPGTSRTLKECFELFPIIHQLINDPETLRSVVLSVLDDFARDNVIYLELRTTPRSSTIFTSELYLWTVLEAVDMYHKENPNGLVCRVLVSISRHLPVENAQEIVRVTGDFIQKAALTSMKDLIVGMELSGNPVKGSWLDFEPIFQDVRSRLRLPISLHFGEVLNDQEANDMLDFKPSRIGHAVVLSESVAERLINKEQDIGIEVCITSNLMSESVPSLREHPVVQRLLVSRHPFALCTDDSGIFDTSLSEEYSRLVECVTLSREQVADIAFKGLELSFCRDEMVMNSVYQTFYRKLRLACCGENGTNCSLPNLLGGSSPLKKPG